MQENETRIYFLGDAFFFYESVTDPQQVLELWEQLAFLQEYNDVDYEIVFEISDGMASYKAAYVPPYTIVFRNEPDGSMDIFSISRPRLLRYEG